MEEIQSLLETLGFQNDQWVVSVFAWMGALRTVFMFLANKLQRGLTKLVAKVRATRSKRDDEVLDAMLNSGWYGWLAMAMDLLASIKLPTKQTVEEETSS